MSQIFEHRAGGRRRCLCSSVQKECCIIGECQILPHKPNPTIACCTWRMNKDKAEESPSQKGMPEGNPGGGPSERE